jgi:hypothetical protein
MFTLVANFCQFKGAITLKNDFFSNLENKIYKITIILKDLNKFPTTQLVYNKMWQFSYRWLPF